MKATIRRHPVSFMTPDLDLAQAIHERIDYYRRNRTDLHDLCEKYEAQLSSARDELITLTNKHSFISSWKTSARREFLEIQIETLKDEVESAPKRLDKLDALLSSPISIYRELMSIYGYQLISRTSDTEEWRRTKPPKVVDMTIMSYADIAQEMKDDMGTIRYQIGTVSERRILLERLKTNLLKCALDENLQELTQCYRVAIDDNPLGYDTLEVIRFVRRMTETYPMKGNK